MMSVAFLKPKKADLRRLHAAVEGNRGDDTLARFLPPETWVALEDYLTEERVARGHVLMAQGALDRTLYFVESGMLRVHRGRDESKLQLALIGPGSVVGEGAFFSHIERSATVQATMDTVLWSLAPRRFERMAKEQPATALGLSLALGAVIATRMLEVSRKISIT
jgi:CRP-like cAMP-binding protein